MDIKKATLDDLKKCRPDLCELLYEEFINTQSFKPLKESKKEVKPQKDLDNGVEGVNKGDVIRWNYTKEEGIVIGFENEDGISNIIVQRYNGTKILFENDPKLYTVLEGEEKSNVISKREKYIAEIKDRKNTGRALIPKPLKKTKTIYDGVVYEEPTRRGSLLKVGYTIRYKLTNELGKIKGFIRKGGLDRIVMRERPGIPSTIIDNPNAYDIIDNCKVIVLPSNYKKMRRRAKVGDVIMLGIDDSIWKVLEIKSIGVIEKLTLIQKNKKTMEIVNSPSLYSVIK